MFRGIPENIIRVFSKLIHLREWRLNMNIRLLSEAWPFALMLSNTFELSSYMSLFWCAIVVVISHGEIQVCFPPAM